MRNTCVIFFILINLYANAQELTGDVKKDLGILLPNGRATLELMDIKQDERIAEIGARVDSAFRSDLPWFTEYAKKYMKDGTIPYHPRMGVTEEEYIEGVIGYMNTLTQEIVYQSEISIVRKGNIITFKPDKIVCQLDQILDGMKVNLVKNTIKVNKNILAFLSAAKISSTIKDPDSSAGQGYIWGSSEEELENILVDNLEDASKHPEKFMNLHDQVTLSRIEQNNKTYLSIRTSISIYGEPSERLDVHIFLTPQNSK